MDISKDWLRKCHRLEFLSLSDDWKLHALDDVSAVEVENHDVDRYWSDVLERRNAVGQLKYCTLGKVVRAALSLSHGNSNAECSFSANKRMVIHEETINALRMVKAAI